jgi:hypothetical protein
VHADAQQGAQSVRVGGAQTAQVCADGSQPFPAPSA